MTSAPLTARTPLTARRALAAAALTSIVALVSACGTSNGQAAAPTVTKTVTTPAYSSSSGGTPASPAPSGSSTGGTSPAAAAGPAACPTRSLGVKLGVSQGTAGSVYQTIDFTNISNVTCTLYGYPGVSFATIGTSGHQVGAAAAENPGTPRKLITLAPKAVANALLQIVDAGNFTPSKCDVVTVHWLVIFPPNQTTPVYLHLTSQTCSKPLRILVVSVVQTGSGSSQ